MFIYFYMSVISDQTIYRTILSWYPTFKFQYLHQLIVWKVYLGQKQQSQISSKYVFLNILQY